MTCQHCGASISEYDIICPYCDSYIDHGFEELEKDNDDTPVSYSALERGYRPEEYDKVKIVLLLLSLFPLVGTVLGAVMIMSGYKKSGTVYLVTSILVFCSPIIYGLVELLIRQIG